MSTLIASVALGMFTTFPINTPPSKPKTEYKPPVYAIVEDRRIVMWVRIAKPNKRCFYRKEYSYEPLCVN